MIEWTCRQIVDIQKQELMMDMFDHIVTWIGFFDLLAFVVFGGMLSHAEKLGY